MGRFIAKHSPLFILAGLCILLAIVSPHFRSFGNLQGVAQRTAVVGVMATGQLAVILTAGIDLSVGSVAALSGVVGCIAMVSGVPVVLAILIGTGVGLLCGLTNGLLVSKGRIPPFIVTLGMMMVARGLTLIFSGATSIFGMPASFSWLGGAHAWWLPAGLMFGIAAVFAVVLNFTRFGRSLYAVGGNGEAARLSGISVDRVRIAAFTISGAAAGFAGMMLASRTSIAAPNAAEMYELYAIAACVIGGASLMGGEGGAFATIAGALIMIVLRNFCNLQDINVYWQQILVGSLLVALVYYDNQRKRKAGLLKN
ncbi:MAG: ABC transporter permease [Candidatus Hydrogenedentes bacterium]|nr:ABC transporter permease [Candidatus Hydrogenedentota bacterium]